MASVLRRSLPLWVSLGVLALLCAVVLGGILSENQGRLIYPLDDTYIHMAMSKHFAERGVWGVTPYAFSSSTSSPLWTLTLALVYRLTGTHEITPLLLNALAVVLLLWVVWRLCLRYAVPAWATLLLLLLVVVFTPSLILIFIGMEHGLHTVLNLCLLVVAAERITQPPSNARLRDDALLWLLGALTAVARYEGLFAVVLIAALLLVRRQWLRALVFAACGLSLFVAYGLVAVANGWSFLPVSILMRGNVGGWFPPDVPLLAAAGNALSRLTVGTLEGLLTRRDNIGLTLLIAGAAGVAWRLRRAGTLWDVPLLACALMMGCVTLHVQFATIGWLNRYESYLVAAGIVCAGLAVLARTPPPADGVGRAARAGSWALAGVAAALAVANGIAFAQQRLAPEAFPLVNHAVKRAAEGALCIPLATANIYDQHYFMAQFLATYYPDGRVAANDIGAINYFADLRNLDLAGLGDYQVALGRMARPPRFGTDEIRALAAERNTTIALVYDSWMTMPPEWELIGLWTLTDRYTAGYPTVSFYAVDPSAAEPLRAQLAAFAPRLPGDVRQEWYPIPSDTVLQTPQVVDGLWGAVKPLCLAWVR